MRLGPTIVIAQLVLSLMVVRSASAQSSHDARPFLAALSVDSVELTANWYATHFGFRILKLQRDVRPGISAALLELNGFHLEIVSLAGSRPRMSVLPDPQSNGSLQGLYKLGLWVSDADSAAQRIVAAGVPLFREPGVDSSLAGGVRYFLVKDPDGTVVQVFGPLRRRQRD